MHFRSEGSFLAQAEGMTDFCLLLASPTANQEMVRTRLDIGHHHVLLQDRGIGAGPSFGTEPGLGIGLWSRHYLWEEVLKEIAGLFLLGSGVGILTCSFNVALYLSSSMCAITGTN